MQIARDEFFRSLWQRLLRFCHLLHPSDMLEIAYPLICCPCARGMAQALLPLEENHNVVEEVIKLYYSSSTSASVASAWGSQNVISMARYNSMAAVSSVRASARRPNLA